MYEYENKDLAEDVGKIINSEVIIATSKYEVFVAVLETDRHFNTYGGSAEDVATLIYDNGLSYWNDEVVVFIDGEFKSVEELIEQLENFEDTDALVEQIDLLDVEINDIKHKTQRIKPIIFTEIAKLFENLENGNELIRIELSKRYVSFVFNVIHNNSFLGKGEIGIKVDGQVISVNNYLQKEYDILKENSYVK